VLGRILPLALVVAGLIASAAPAVAAAADATTPQGSTASVSFVDDRARTISYEDVVAKDGLKVLVHNDATRTQDISVRVIGLADSTDPVVQTFLSDDPVVKRRLPPGGSALAVIPLGDPGADPGEAEEFSAVVVASGETGGLARVPLNLTSSADGSDGADPNLSAKFAPDLTLTAVNYLPSPLGATRPTLLLLVALSALAALLIKVRAIRIPERKPPAGSAPATSRTRADSVMNTCSAFAIVGLLAWAIWTLGAHHWTTGPSIHAISARPIPVASDVTPQTVGFASSDAGAVARLEVGDDHNLRPKGLESAAAFTGVYDLNPADSVAGAKATINVRDWWPWATLLISLGVLLGVWLRKWYQRVRPQSQLRIRATELRDRSKPLRGGAPVRGFDVGVVMTARIDELMDRVDGLVKNGDAAAAGKLLDTLEAQLTPLGTFRNSLIDLDRNAAHVRELALRERLDPSAARLLPKAERLLDAAKNGIDLVALDADGLKARTEDIGSTAGLLARVAGLCATVAAHRALARALLWARPTDPDTRTALATLLGKLDELAAKVLQANTDAELEACETEDDEAARHLRTLGRAPIETAIEPVVVMTSEWQVNRMRERSLIAADIASGAAIELQTPTCDAHLSWRAIAMGDDDTVYLNDEVEFTAHVSPWPDAAWTAIEFRYSDGTHETAPVTADGTAVDRPTMATPGALTVSIHSVPDGRQFDSKTIHVGTESRGAVERSALSEKDKAIAWVAGILAVGSGLLSLYVNDPAWGETSDYLAAALWGAVTAEGVKLAVAIADRAWPAP
jgi:hypothetical protein